MTAKISFDPEKHEYRVNGIKYPNVTNILNPLTDLSSVHPDILARACEFGGHVHLACELYDHGNLDVDSLDPGLVPYLNGWKMFLDACKPKFAQVEERVFSERYRYAGTLDRAGIMDGKKSIIDIKSGLHYPATGPQTVAYTKALEEMTGFRAVRRYTVQLSPDNFKLIQHADKNDFNIFLSCLNIHNYLESH